MNLAELGLTQERLEELVVDRLVESMLNGDDEHDVPRFAEKARQKIQERIDAAVVRLGDEVIGPQITDLVAGATMQATTAWGESKGPPVTFREYLVQRAEVYLTEKVDFRGMGKAESRDSYNWNAAQTRITHMIHEHLQYHISCAMKQALAEANSHIAKGIAEAVKVSLAEVMKGIQCSVAVKQ